MAEAKLLALDIGRQRGLTYINGYDHPNIIAGQGTIGLEICEQVSMPDVVVVPVGGGGLIAGVATAVKAMSPKTKIIVSEFQLDLSPEPSASSEDSSIWNNWQRIFLISRESNRKNARASRRHWNRTNRLKRKLIPHWLMAWQFRWLDSMHSKRPARWSTKWLWWKRSGSHWPSCAWSSKKSVNLFDATHRQLINYSVHCSGCWRCRCRWVGSHSSWPLERVQK